MSVSRSVAHDHAADHRAFRAEPDQRLVGRDAVAGERGEVADGLDEVGLALAVGADQGGDARTQRQLRLRVAAEVGDAQVPDVHITT